MPSLLAGRYRIVSPLGSGGMADVYLAEDERLGRLVAVKVLKARLAADDEFLERFRIEARAAASLNHPSIVGVYDRGSADGATYIAMEYVSGESLKQRLRRDGALPQDEAVTIALAVLSALAAAHARNIVHRDVTSYNVMLDEGGRVVVTDFGIARMGDSALTRTGAMMGTSSYLSPEQAQGRQADERSDLYSLGVVLYEMLTGRVPFRGETDVAVAMQHVSTAPPNPRTLEPAVSEALAGVAMRALSKDPDDRYQTADEFAAALRKARRPARALADDGVTAAGAIAAVGPPEPRSPPARRGRASSPPSRAPRRPAAPARTPAAGPPASAGPQPVRPPAAPASVPEPTVLLADAPTRYRSGEPATTVRPRRRRRRRAHRAGRRRSPLVAAAAAWAAYTYLFAPGATVPKVVGLAPRRRDRRDPRSGSAPRPALRLGRQVRPGRGGAPVAARRRVRGRRRQGRPLGEPRSAAHPVARPHRSRRRRRPEPAGGGVAQRQEPAGGVGDGAQGPDLQAEARRGSDGAARRHRDLLGEQRAAEDRRARRRRPLAGRRQGALEDDGFTVSSDYVAGWGSFPGDVVGQDPVAGSPGRVGDEVVIQVAVF